MSETPDETVPVRRDPAEDAVQTSLELRIRYSDRPREVVPVNRATLEHRVADTALRFTYAGGQVRFRCLSGTAYKDGRELEAGSLEVGSYLEVGNHRVLLWDAGHPIAYIKGYSAPYSNEIWPLGAGSFPVGRAGKRSNAIQLDHPTVSREHATILAADDGVYQILAESSTNPVFLGGQAVESGSMRELRHGDLIELGELVFRFYQPETSPASTEAEASLHVRSLGGFSVQIASATVPDRAWKTQYVKWLFAHLAYRWGAPLGVEVLIEELWPEAEPSPARKNFNYSLSVLRSALRAHCPPSLQSTDVIMRSSSALQLNPDLLGQHDVITLQRLARTPRDEDPGWEQAVTAALEGYAGPFLPECYLDWAVSARQTLELQAMEMFRRLLTRLSQRGDWDALATVGSQVMEIDRLDQWTCLQVLRALGQSGRLQEALRLFERCRALWKKELGAEPGSEFLEEAELIRARL